MKPKHDANGDPSVIYVQDLMDEWLGEAAARVILPITDPYVVHHGALGGFGDCLFEGADRFRHHRKLRGLTAYPKFWKSGQGRSGKTL